MARILVDGIEIDSENWIDAHVAKFLDAGSPWAARREALRREIADYKQVLASFEAQTRKDTPGEAHTKAYLAALTKAEATLWGEVDHGSATSLPDVGE